MQQDGLGEFQFQIARLQPDLRQHFADVAAETGLAELVGRNVDRHHQLRTVALPAPVQHLAAGVFQHPIADLRDQPGIFGNRDKLRRADQTQFRVAPADQSFAADHPVAANVDLGLVIQFQLVAFDGSAQAVFHRQFVEGGHVQRFAEELVVVVAVFAGVVHREFAVLDETVFVHAVAGVDRDADIDAQEQFRGFDRKRLLHDLKDALGDFDAVAGVLNPVQQHGKGTAAQPGYGHVRQIELRRGRYEIAFPNFGDQPVGEHFQHVVADFRPQRFVDAFEAGDTDEQRRQRRAVAVAIGHGLAQNLLEQRAVGQSGQRVVIGQKPYPFFDVAAFGNVLNRAADAFDRIVLDDGFALDVNYPVAAVPVRYR